MNDETKALASMQREQGPLDVIRFAFDIRAAIRALGRTARGALVLAYIAPCHLRTPDARRACPEGWRVVELVNQGHTVLNGTWWVCDEAFPNLEVRFASGGRT